MRANWLRHVQASCASLANLAAEAGVPLDTNGGDDGMNDHLEAVNFEDHDFKEGVTDELKHTGLYVGCNVKICHCSTVEFGKGPLGRKDVTKGEAAFVKGMANGLSTPNKQINKYGTSIGPFKKHQKRNFKIQN